MLFMYIVYVHSVQQTQSGIFIQRFVKFFQTVCGSKGSELIARSNILLSSHGIQSKELYD